MTVRVSVDAFSPGAELDAFIESKAGAGAGAAVAFTGVVRSHPDDPVKSLTLECYHELAVSQIEGLVAEAMKRFGLLDATVLHRFGKLEPGEPIVQVMTLSSHREAAFSGAAFLMDFLKTDAPFWKQESGPWGTRWVESKHGDERARAGWM